MGTAALLLTGNSHRGIDAFSHDLIGFYRYLWQAFSPTWPFSDAPFWRSATSLANVDFAAVALHSCQYRIADMPSDPALKPIEQQLSMRPRIEAPTIVLLGADEGVNRPEGPSGLAPNFEQLQRVPVLPDVGHNAPQDAPKTVTDAVLEVGR